jgi:DNA-binding response OmpR family regulator
MDDYIAKPFTLAELRAALLVVQGESEPRSDAVPA